MMNEPVDAAAVAAPPAAPMGQAPAGGMGGEGGMSPQMLMQMLQTLPEEQRNAMMQQLQQLPPDQLAQLMQAAVGQGGMPGGGQGGPPPGAIQVTQEEMASVENLEAMTGSSRIQAVQVSLVYSCLVYSLFSLV